MSTAVDSHYYDPNEVLPHSPGLEAIKPKATPSPSPPPVEVVRQIEIHSFVPNVSSPSHKRRRKLNRQKPQPSLGDAVLLRSIDPNHPDIAQIASERTLPDSGSEGEDEDGGMGDSPSTAEPVSSIPILNHVARPYDSILQATAQKALDTNPQSNPAPPPKYPPPFHRDSVVEIDHQSRLPHDIENRNTQENSSGPTANGVHLGTNGVDSNTPTNSIAQPAATSSTLTGERRASGAVKNYPHGDSIATSSNLGQLAIPQSKASPSQKLPAFQPPQSPRDGPPGSPNQDRRLPSFKHLTDIADAATSEQQENGRVNGFNGHRPSISSSTQSPTLATRQPSITALSPGTPFPSFHAGSPLSAASETTSKDLFLRSGQSHLSLFSPRRPSQASDTGPYSATIHSASTTNESYTSSDGLSPGSQPTPIEGRGHRMSIDGALNSRTLPLPNGPHIHHVPPHGSGGFKCDHPGCTAAPFQTQYLLNSHANVHSQTRPHFCPVPDCPRGERGKGFKRKNEMIRHGLVHQSPGYVCPFCPDREHKYPRPDNLQRHVRVHHVDKDKDDPQLRDVLAQRPEGGSRGRRRRNGSA